MNIFLKFFKPLAKIQNIFIIKNKNNLTSQSQQLISHLAFTLAEVLIVLGIIGIIAELTIPTIINDTRKQETIAALKKSFSTLSQVYITARSENGSPQNWSLTNGTGIGSTNMFNQFAPSLKIAKDCGIASNLGCFPSSTYPLNGTSTGIKTLDSESTLYKILLADGTSMRFYSQSADCTLSQGSKPVNICGLIRVDTNGLKQPNVFGKDNFVFYLTPNGIFPSGLPGGKWDNGFSRVADAGQCSMAERGVSCAAWIIYNQNMDYLKCDDLTWGGKTECD